MEIPKGSRPSSTVLPGLWWAMSKHWLSCKLWEDINIEYHVSISFRWLGTLGLKIITTPLESFIIAGQHVSNLWREYINTLLKAIMKSNWKYVLPDGMGILKPLAIERVWYLTYLKSPEQSQSSTSHLSLSWLPSACDSNSSILWTVRDTC